MAVSRNLNPDTTSSMKPAVLTALKPFNLTTEADVSLLLDPSRHAVCGRGYRIKSGFPDQVCTDVCTRFSLTKLWLLFLSSGELRLRLYFRTVEQCNQSWDVITSAGLNCTNDKSKHGAVSEKLSFQIDVLLETLFSKSATFAENAFRIKQHVERVLNLCGTLTKPEQVKISADS